MKLKILSYLLKNSAKDEYPELKKGYQFFNIEICVKTMITV